LLVIFQFFISALYCQDVSMSMQGITRMPMDLNNNRRGPRVLPLAKTFQDWLNNIKVFNFVQRELEISTAKTS